MNRSILVALLMGFAVTVASAEAAAPKGKVGIRKPTGVMQKGASKTAIYRLGAAGSIGKVYGTMKGIGPINGAPAFPVKNPPRFPNGGHGPVVFNPTGHRPINGLPVPYKPIHNHHHGSHRNWHWYGCNDYCVATVSCDDDCSAADDTTDTDVANVDME